MSGLAEQQLPSSKQIKFIKRAEQRVNQALTALSKVRALNTDKEMIHYHGTRILNTLRESVNSIEEAFKREEPKTFKL